MRGNRSIYIKNMEAVVGDGRTGEYRSNTKIFFLLEASSEICGPRWGSPAFRRDHWTEQGIRAK